MSTLEILFYLIFAHFVGDFVLQSRWMAENKGSHSWLMITHCVLYTGAVSIALLLLGGTTRFAIPIIFWTHFLLDTIKDKQLAGTRNVDNLVRLDQAAHITILILIAFAVGAV